MKKIKVSIKKNKIGDYFLCFSKFFSDDSTFPIDSKIIKCNNKIDLAKRFVLKSFQINSFNKITSIDKNSFNQIISSIEWAAMKMEEADPFLSRFLIKYKVMATKYYEGNYELVKD